MSEAWVITSGKGGVGKSTLAANLAVSLTREGKTVALVDCDTGLRNLDVLLGLQDRVIYDLCDLAEGMCRLKQGLVPHREFEGLFLVAAAQTRESGAVTPAQMEKLTERLLEKHDYVLLDCPAGLGRGFRMSVAGAQRAIVVTMQDVVSLRDAERAVGLLKRSELNAQLVVNRAHWTKPDDPMSPEAMAERLYIPLLGVVPEDRAIERRVQEGRPAAADASSPCGAAYRRIAGRLTGAQTPIPPLKRDSLIRRLINR